MKQDKHTVFIVDDHALILRGLKNLIEHEHDLEVCGVAETIDQLRKGLGESSPDVVVLDLGIGAGTGVNAIREIKSINSEIKILVSSMKDESVFATQCIRAGANGFINKDAELEDLLKAIHQVLGDGIAVSPAIASQLNSKGKSSTGSGIELLSKRELEVFELIGKGLSTKQIAAVFFRSTKTIDSYRERIKQKLEIKSFDELRYFASVSVN